jgi:hypothetical protein
MKSILVFSHDHNSFDKKHLLENPNNFMSVSDKKVEDFVKEQDLKQFFMDDIDNLLKMYEPGKPENKPDVLKQLDEIKQQREEMVAEHQRKQLEYQDTINKVNQMYGQQGSQNLISNYENRMNQMSVIMQELTMENKLLTDKVKYLEDKIRQIIKEQIEKSKLNKVI